MSRIYLIIAVVLTTSVSSFGQIGFNNPSFEQPIASSPSNIVTVTPSSVVSGFNTASTWNVTAGSVDIVKVGSGGYWNDAATNGSQILDLAGSARGTIQQTINTGSSTSFNFQFDYSRNVDYIPGALQNNTFSASVRIFAGSTNYLNTTVTINSLLDGRSTNNFNWQNFAQTVNVPANTNITLEFADTSTVSGTSQGILIDNIRPVPEPTSMLLGASAIGMGLTWLRRRCS